MMQKKKKSKYDPTKNKIYIQRIDSMIKNSINKLIKQKLKNENHDFLIELVQLKIQGIKVKINKKLERTLGQATYTNYNNCNKIIFTTIELNPCIFDMSIKFKRELITHELAHCWDFYIRGDSVHDKFWRSLHREFNGTGSTYIDTEAY